MFDTYNGKVATLPSCSTIARRTTSWPDKKNGGLAGWIYTRYLIAEFAKIHGMQRRYVYQEGTARPEQIINNPTCPFSILHINYRNLISLLLMLPVQIVVLTETWLTEELVSSIHKFRVVNRYITVERATSGRVGFLISSELINQDVTDNMKSFESV